MLRSTHPPADADDDHLRQLLDQRTARADSQGRFSALSHFDDTPSIYSPPFFSQRPAEPHPTSPEPQLKSPTVSTFSARTHQERRNDPSASMLDLDDDPRLSTASDIYHDEQLPGDDDNEAQRMSYLGPKMRFHSRAPWEMDQDTLDEEDEPDRSTLLPTSRKGFGFSSPRSSNASRPSGESTRSQAKSKKSFETSASQISYPRGALYALAQESLSTSSLGTSTAGQKTLRGKFSLSRVRSESPNNSVPPSPASGARSPNHIPLTNLPLKHHAPDSRTPPSSHQRPTFAADDFHPYANPDLVFSLADDQPHLTPQQTISRSGSIMTVTDSIAHSSLSRSGTKSTLAPVTSVSSVNPRNRASTVQGKEISSPIPVLSSAHRLDSNVHVNEDSALMLPPPGLDNLPGWTDRGPSQTFSLISLEEARAQRMRSATTQPAKPRPLTTTSAVSSSVVFPDDSDNGGLSIDHSGSGPLPQRARARSISAGSKAKNALQTIVGSGQAKSEHHEPDNGAAGKTLKHKKSGFMRLFNGGRGQEKEEKVQPPPVPPLSDAYAAINAQAVHKASKITSHRMRFPEPSPSPLETSSSQGEIPPTSSLSAVPLRPSPSPKRPVPPLSINTQPQGYAPRAPVSAVDDSSCGTRTLPSSSSSYAPQQPWLNTSTPQSAPANVSEFPALKLRPVSTLFSAQFGDHIVTQDSRPSLETDVGTPGSSTTNVFSPVTPGSASRSDRSSSDNKPTFMTPISEDRSSVVNALQDQILNTKLAWQRQIWELEGEVRNLKAEIDDLRKSDSDKGYCAACGRGQPAADRDRQAEVQEAKNVSVVHRPRARTGTSSRFGSALS